MGIYGPYTSRDWRTDPNTGMPTTSPAGGYAPEVVRLANTLVRQKNKAGIGEQQGSPSLISRIFDVAQRPLYASANASKAIFTRENPVAEAWQGLTGQEKTTYDDVLGEMGLSGGWQRAALGLGLDIALDPLTWTGAGVLKSTSKAAAAKAGADVMLEETIKSVDEIPNIARNLQREASLSGQKMTKKEADALATEQFRDSAVSRSMEARDKAYAEGRGKVVLKIAGRPLEIGRRAVTEAETKVASAGVKRTTTAAGREQYRVAGGKFAPRSKIDEFKSAEEMLAGLPEPRVVGSEKLYRAGQMLGEGFNAIPGAQQVAAAFRPLSTFTQGTHTALREAYGHAFNDGEEALRRLKIIFGDEVSEIADTGFNTIPAGMWGGLGEGTRSTIAKAIETGDDLSNLRIEATGKTLEEYKKAAIEHFEKLWAVEALDMGIRNPKSRLQNYVQHTYKGGTPEEQKAFRNSRKVQNSVDNMVDPAGNPMPLSPADNEYTLSHAIDQGLKPETDILKILGNRTIESFRAQGKARFARAIDNEFGVHLTQEAVKQLGKKKNLGKAMGLEQVKNPHFVNGEAWFHPEVAKVLRHSIDYLDDPSSGADFLRLFDKLQNMWKLNMTALNPNHHIRNFAGDIFLNWEDGVFNPARYREAMKVLQVWRDNPNAIVFKIGDMPVNAADMMTYFSQHGGKAGFFRHEFAESGFANLIGKHPIEAVRRASEMREDWTRMAHFIDVMKKEGGKAKNVDDLKAVARTAGQRVRKFNIDYGDLTQFERTWMKRTIPFYTWMRKNVPLQLEVMALDPGKINVIPKGMRALQQALGTEGDLELSGLILTPKWLRDMAGVRIAGEGMGRNDIYWSPSVFPFTSDIPRLFGGGTEGFSKQMASSMSPPLRMLFEKASGRSLNTGGPIGEGGLMYYSQQTVPPTLQTLATMGQRAYAGKPIEIQDILKLGGISAYPVGPQQQLGELRRQQDIVQAILRKKNPPPKRSWEE